MVKNLPVMQETQVQNLVKVNGCPSQYSCLENSKDRGTFWATDHVNQESEMTEQLVHTHIHTQTLDIPYPPEIGEVLKVFFFS